MDWGVGAFCLLLGDSDVRRTNETRRSPRRRDVAPWIAILSAVAALLMSAPNAGAQSEDQVMAAFLLNFARYVEWPENAFDRGDAPVTICMMGSKGFGEVVSKTVSGKTVDNRPVEINPDVDLLKTDGCHIVFIGRNFDRSPRATAAALDGLGVFSVADQEGFASAGGIANFYRDGNRIRFEINPKAAKKAGLKISSQLLRLAKVVN